MRPFEQLTPMLLTASAELPKHERDWAYELKWDGMRALCRTSRGGFQIRSRNGTDFTASFPELAPLARFLQDRSSVILDGEVVCFAPSGRPSFSRIRRRWAPGAARHAAELARRLPATFVAFDILLDGDHWLLDHPYAQRRAILDSLKLADPRWLTTAFHVGDGEALVRASREQKFEGIVAKKLTSHYRPGVRSSQWLKLKNYQTADFTVGGWLASVSGHLEALLVGTGDGPSLRFAGTVEFGLAGKRFMVRELLDLIPRQLSPFERDPGRSTSPRIRYVEPRLTVSVRFIGWDAGVLREPIFRSIRLDEEPIAAAPVRRPPGG